MIILMGISQCFHCMRWALESVPLST